MNGKFGCFALALDIVPRIPIFFCPGKNSFLRRHRLFRDPSLSLAGSVFGHIEQLKILADLDASIYIPGHGPVVDKDYVSDSRDFLIKVQEEARKCFDKGMTAQEAAKTIDMTSKRWPYFSCILSDRSMCPGL